MYFNTYSNHFFHLYYIQLCIHINGNKMFYSYDGSSL